MPTKSQKKLSEQPELSIRASGLFFIEGTNVHVIPLYRGDGRMPEAIFPEGFSARGTNPDLVAHVDAGARHSIYVSTSRSKDVSTRFTAENSHKGKKSFLYEINPQKTGIDVLKTLKPDIKSGTLGQYVVEHAMTEKEVAVPHKIKNYDIKGIWVIENNQHTGTTTTYVKNPHYIAPLSKVSRVLRTAGKISTVVGAAADGIDLWYAFSEAQISGDYRRVFREGARVAGGWTGAAMAGAACGEMGVLWFAPLGPVASLLGGLTLGAVGSIAGYFSGGMIAQEMEEMIERALGEGELLCNVLSTVIKGNLVVLEHARLTANIAAHKQKLAHFRRTIDKLSASLQTYDRTLIQTDPVLSAAEANKQRCEQIYASAQQRLERKRESLAILDCEKRAQKVERAQKAHVAALLRAADSFAVHSRFRKQDYINNILSGRIPAVKRDYHGSNLYTRVNVPLPDTNKHWPEFVEKFSENDTNTEIEKKLDRYFEEIIRDFPEETKALQRNMYYHNFNVKFERMGHFDGRAHVPLKQFTEISGVKSTTLSVVIPQFQESCRL